MHSINKRQILLFSFASLLLLGGVGVASVTSTWKVDDYEGFNKGEAKSAIITSLGEVRPGWGHDSIELPFDNPWSTAVAPDGTVYIGSDDKATIYKRVGDKVVKHAKIGKAVAVVSMVVDKSGTIYAGTMPDGEIWSVSKSGKTNKLVTLKKTETVWSLALANGTLYAGTGPEGLLYEINTSTGKATMRFDSEDKRIMSLLATGDDAIWMGTSDQALVFRFDRKTNKTRAIADFAGNEVSALAEHDGTVIAAANAMKPGSSTGFKTKEAVDKADKKKDPGQEVDLPKEGSKPGADKPASNDVEPLAKSLRKGTGALFRIRGDGHLTQIHALRSSYFTSVAVNAKGQIFAGAADEGRVYLVEEEDEVSTAFDVEERYVAQIVAMKNGQLLFTTGDSAQLFTSKGAATASSYLSEVFDAETPAKYGRLSWNAKGSVTIETRTGNTEKPGPGWSPWQAPTNSLRGAGNEVRATVQSPTGRYFQFRARFASDDASLQRAQLFYLPGNRHSVITEITTEAIGRTSFATLSRQIPSARSPKIKIKWKVDNADKDRTLYKLEVRREGEVAWRKIPTGSGPLTTTSFEWNSETYSDGYYRLRITASDRMANTIGRTLETTKTTPLFAVDNTRPDIAGVNVAYPAASARATDALSTIAEIAFSVDDGPWRVGGPRDGILDDRTELLDLQLPDKLAPGRHTLSIRVSDEPGNIATTTTSFVVK